MRDLIEPRVLKGFRDFLPDRESERLAILRKLEEVFRLCGFSPIDTPVLEYAEVLLGKGGGETDKQVYRFRDHGGRDVALRFDLTVPFARFMAAHMAELPLPFRRWHGAKVWRGENTQRGRYREFMQVDFDIVGADSASADLEILLLMRRCMRTLGMERFTIHFAHRGLFNSFLGRLGLESRSVEVLRSIDKARKVGEEKTFDALEGIAGGEKARIVQQFVQPEKSWTASLAKLREMVGPDDAGIERLSAISSCLEELDLSTSFSLDPSITRGLDYYTGVVFETFLADLPSIGSVCSGGRYNDLASLYTHQRLPGVGASIGIDRLMAALEELGLASGAASAPSILVACLEERLLGSYHRVAEALREAGISAEVYPEQKKLATQFSYAEKKGIPLALVIGEKEAEEGVMGLKDLRSRQSYDALALESAIGKCRELLR
ncbi:MAG TPA: histidine--tRNA ligase [Spirochaetia bacterium]|nr:histidine--tRNA ligase [Spirochaetia bacterium]